jgi:hypothetical protein
VPTPSGLDATPLDIVEGGLRLCMSDIAISAETEQARIIVGTYFKPGPPLHVTVKGPGYNATADVPAGFKDNATLAIPLPKPKHSELVTMCIRNGGKRKIAIYGAGGRSQSRVQLSINGVAGGPPPQLSFYSRNPVSIASNAGVTAGRIAVFRGFLDHAWIVWLLAILVVVAVPILLAFALRGAEETGE